ncbi:DUF3717 domain-containing protein|uniref:DUF3717 domain-containing protein n=1 Tax=Noviherbaspirillum sp. L7-7A TaxID=2850560 RepID=UPI001C2C0789|nr:DUF3717 domain-containing protein [Noviherbaspirillum sp. L7-7A]MBV0880811.1 DUF3717 domain-containing protein [Noviherbaspirillum sp. L7-7A]
MDNHPSDIALADLEQAINYWRNLRPSRGEERSLSPEVNRLAEVYALMIYERLQSLPLARIGPDALALIEAWRAKRV